jgi:hypothetical protein
MSSSNSWAEFAAIFRNTRAAFLDHERAKSELKNLIPEDAKEAIGHGVREKPSKSGAVRSICWRPISVHQSPPLGHLLLELSFQLARRVVKFVARKKFPSRNRLPCERHSRGRCRLASTTLSRHQRVHSAMMRAELIVALCPAISLDIRSRWADTGGLKVSVFITEDAIGGNPSTQLRKMLT